MMADIEFQIHWYLGNSHFNWTRDSKGNIMGHIQGLIIKIIEKLNKFVKKYYVRGQ